MGQKKCQKGTVSVDNAQGRIRLRWRYQQKRYSLSLYAYSKAGLLEAKKIAVQIEHDIIHGTLDFTLDRYKPNEQHHILPKEKRTLADLFREWATDYRHKDCEKDIDYLSTYKMIQRWSNVKPEAVLQYLNKERFSARTYNRRLTMLKNFFKWGVKKKVVDVDPLEDVMRKKVSKVVDPKRKPFTLEEIQKILKAFKEDTFTPRSSYIKHSFYFPFLYFIFKMGVRNAEAIGLRVKHIDLNNKVVDIVEVMARTPNCSHSSARIRKETKNGKERRLPLDEEAATILLPLIIDKEPDNLVFQSPKGHPIDDRAFQRRIFKKVLKELKIEDRVLYACRHTFGSRCIHEGLTPVMTAFLMGNNPETALRNYTHQLDIPKSLPLLNEKIDG